jgi:hypothetical protein
VLLGQRLEATFLYHDFTVCVSELYRSQLRNHILLRDRECWQLVWLFNSPIEVPNLRLKCATSFLYVYELSFIAGWLIGLLLYAGETRISRDNRLELAHS